MCKNNNTSEDDITLTRTYPSDMQVIGNIDPYFGDTLALPEMDKIHEEIVFDNNYSFKRSYNIIGKVISFYLDTKTA